jgi:hypothetical protein
MLRSSGIYAEGRDLPKGWEMQDEFESLCSDLEMKLRDSFQMFDDALVGGRTESTGVL